MSFGSLRDWVRHPDRGTGYGAHMPTHWIAVVLLGIGILSRVKTTRQKDSSEQSVGANAFSWPSEASTVRQRADSFLSRSAPKSRIKTARRAWFKYRMVQIRPRISRMTTMKRTSPKPPVGA